MKLVWIIVGFVVIVLAIVILSATGVINLSWQDLTIIGAAIVGPLKSLFDSFGGKDEVDEILQNAKAKRDAEEAYRKEMDAAIAEKQKRVDDLNKELAIQAAKLEVVEEKKKRIAAEVKTMTVEETKKEAQDLLGE